MKATNRHGLSRHIPENVAREVRQRDGFGCVVCGNAIYEYEHFDPPFADAINHTVSGIILLCSNCHTNKGSLISRNTIAEAARNPCCKRAGFSRGAFDAGTGLPELVIGTFVGRNIAVLLRVMGENILFIHPPEAPGAPYRINARLKDEAGKDTLSIVDNEWRVNAENWDAYFIKSDDCCRIIVQQKLRDFSLILRFEPAQRVVVERIHMHHRGVRLACREGSALQVETGSTSLQASDIVVDGCFVGLDVWEDRIGIGGGPLPPPIGGFAGGAMTGGGASPTMGRRVRRNSPCWCGSGLRFKRCHGRH